MNQEVVKDIMSFWVSSWKDNLPGSSARVLSDGFYSYSAGEKG